MTVLAKRIALCRKGTHDPARPSAAYLQPVLCFFFFLHFYFGAGTERGERFARLIAIRFRLLLYRWKYYIYPSILAFRCRERKGTLSLLEPMLQWFQSSLAFIAGAIERASELCVYSTTMVTLSLCVCACDGSRKCRNGFFNLNFSSFVE